MTFEKPDVIIRSSKPKQRFVEELLNTDNNERMIKMKKILALVLALCMIFALSACGKNYSTLKEIQEAGVLTVATSPDFAPMEFVDSSKTGQDQYVGFDITLAKFIAYKMGVAVQIDAMSIVDCPTGVDTGKKKESI